MDAERREFKRDELAAELGGEEQRAQQIMRGTWYIVIDGQVWQRGGQPVTFSGRDAARRAGQTIKNRSPGKTVTITTRIPAVEAAACNHTMEGEMCPQHGLAECGMAEGRDDPMNYNAAITGSYYESQDTDLLARIKQLALLK
jgi:predicted heme/steroid binding protein